MVVPGLIAVISPVIVGYYDKEARGPLVGVTVGGVLLAIFQSNAGGVRITRKSTSRVDNSVEKVQMPIKRVVTLLATP